MKFALTEAQTMTDASSVNFSNSFLLYSHLSITRNNNFNACRIVKRMTAFKMSIKVFCSRDVTTADNI